MKVIFLDIDGVMNFSREDYATGEWIIEWDKWYILKDIVEETGAKIVLSSDWRKEPYLYSMVLQMLSGADIKELYDVTPNLSGDEAEWEQIESFRAVEILDWLEEHPEVDRYAAIDDIYLPELENNAFLTVADFGLSPDANVSWLGLTPNLAQKIILHLNTEL